MATKVFMEALSPTMEEGRLVKWLKNEGDPVKSGDVLAEVETDKAIMELTARGDGVLRKRLVNEGESKPVGALVGVIAAPDENIDALVASAGGGGSAPAASAPAPSAPAPSRQADPVPAPQVNAQQSTGPSQGAPAPQPPAAPPRPAPAPSAPTPQPIAAHSGNGGGSAVRSSPLARRLASERGVNLGALQGSGPGGRIIKRDIEAAATAGASAPAASRPDVAPSAPVISREGDYQDVPLTNIRKVIAKRLGESIGPIPTFYLTVEVDLTRVMEMRAAMAETGDEFKVSVNDVLLKAIAVALSQHPEVNAHWLGDHIRYFNRVHLGMAVATDDGLIVPVIWDADRKRMSEISRDAKELAKRARERKLKPEEFTGSTFSVSNLGMFGIDQFTAIINPPEAGIIAIGTSEDKIVVVNGEPVVRKRIRLTMSCDHRVIDGAVGAKFLQTLRRLIENPLMLVY
ncbi:MAG TPA: pyruvate dehydrogenase complex dihydrolipoamide acetyltransferase [Gemmatimonadaceae bacterium]